MAKTAAKSDAVPYSVGKWDGNDLFVCGAEGCEANSLDLNALNEHAKAVHKAPLADNASAKAPE